MKEKKKGGEVGKACDKKVKLTITTCPKRKKWKKKWKRGEEEKMSQLVAIVASRIAHKCELTVAITVNFNSAKARAKMTQLGCNIVSLN